MRSLRAITISILLFAASHASAQPAQPTQQNAQVHVPLTTQAIQRFVTWIESHPNTTQVSMWTDDATMTALIADENGSLLCVGARNAAAACVRDPRVFHRLWRTGIREGADGHISGVSVAAGPLPQDAAHGVVIDFALPAATVQHRNSVALVNGSPPSTPVWMGQPFEDSHPGSIGALPRATPDVAPAEGPPWMADSARIEVVPLNGDVPAIRVSERFSTHQAVCVKLQAGWRCARRDISLAETEGEEAALRVVDLHAAAIGSAPWIGVEYEWHQTSTSDGAHGQGGTFVEVVQFDGLAHLLAKFTTGEISWINAMTTVGGRRRFQRNATRTYHAWHPVGAGCIELAPSAPEVLPVDIDFHSTLTPPRTPARRAPAHAAPAPEPAAAPAPDAAAPGPTRLRFDGAGAFVPGDC